MTANIQLQPESLPRGNYVLLTADTLDLLLPQHEVGAAEYLEGVLEATDQAGLCKLAGAESTRRFAALSEQMTLLSQCPPERFLVTPLRDEVTDIGWCWNELRILIDIEFQLHPLPAVLLTPDTPVQYYVEFEGKLAYLCSAQQLSAYALAARS